MCWPAIIFGVDGIEGNPVWIGLSLGSVFIMTIVAILWYNHVNKGEWMNDKIEEILYQALDEGIKDKVLRESNRLSKLNKYKHLEVGDRLEIAYNNIKTRNNGNKK